MDDYPLLVHFYDFEKRIKYICRMINIINVQNLSQENVSCLNTTIVVLMLANKKDQMAKYLNAINSKSITGHIMCQVFTTVRIDNRTKCQVIFTFR